MDIEDDNEGHRQQRGIPRVLPVLMEDDDNISVEDIKRMAEEAPIFDSKTKSYSQIRRDLEELDEVVQEFSRGKGAQKYILGKQTNRNF